MSEDRIYTGSYFLDTSTLISLQWDDPDVRARVQSDLDRKDCYSSVYVRCQYKTRIVKSLIFIHTLVETSKSLNDARRRLERNKGKPDELTHRIAMRLLGFAQTTEEVTRRLERLIESDACLQFDAVIRHELCDCTRCSLGDEIPPRRGACYWDIDKCPGECGIQEFWSKQKKDLEVLAKLDVDCYSGPTDHKGTIVSVQNQARKIIHEGESPRGKACKETLDDSIIAIEARECRPGITIHTRDRDFEVLKQFLCVDVRVFR